MTPIWCAGGRCIRVGHVAAAVAGISFLLLLCVCASASVVGFLHMSFCLLRQDTGRWVCIAVAGTVWRATFPLSCCCSMLIRSLLLCWKQGCTRVGTVAHIRTVTRATPGQVAQHASLLLLSLLLLLVCSALGEGSVPTLSQHVMSPPPLLLPPQAVVGCNVISCRPLGVEICRHVLCDGDAVSSTPASGCSWVQGCVSALFTLCVKQGCACGSLIVLQWGHLNL